MVKASRVFPKDHKEFRSYVRLRHKLIQKNWSKNEAHSILAPEMFNLNDVLTDIFGKNGRMILSGIISGKTNMKFFE
jgi:ribosomal protein L11 methylase PrmA